MTLKISTSESNLYRDCKQKWWYEYEQLLTQKVPSEYLIFGIAVHEALEQYHGHGYIPAPKFAKSFRRQLEEIQEEFDDEATEHYEELINLGKAMLDRYLEFHANSVVPSFEVISVEQEFSLDLGDGVILRGKIDGLVRDEYGKLFVLEHKTAADITSKYIDNLDRDHQIDNYLLGATALTDGEPIAGVMYNILAKQVPTPPKVLKNGSLSQDKRQKTTAAMYRDKIAELGLTESDYSDILNLLDVQGEPYFRRLKVYRNQTELERARQELLDVAADMRSGLVYRNHSACKFRGCSYHAICLEDTPEGRENYRIKTRRHEELKGEENND